MSDTLTVSQYAKRLGDLINNSAMLCNVAVVGEISGLRINRGHHYFSLVDEESSIKCTMFAGSASKLTFRPKDGDKVLVYGKADHHPKYGLSFLTVMMRPYGKGDAQAALEELTAKLLAEGLFDPERKRPLPRFPRVVGVVTSETGAVIKDIVDTSAARFPADILLAPASVQGDGAPASIVRGIDMLNRYGVDVIIVGRGGGSKEDLSAFNDESVVRAIAASKAPVISAVGHATDRSLSDRVADAYAVTPTAAACAAVPAKDELSGEIDSVFARASKSLSDRIHMMKVRFGYSDARLSPVGAKSMVDMHVRRLESLSAGCDSALKAAVMDKSSRFDRVCYRIDPRRAEEMLAHLTMDIEALSDNLDAGISSAMNVLGSRIDVLSKGLDALDPLKVLGRGYSMVRGPSGEVLVSVTQLSAGDEAVVTFRDGTAVTSVKEVKRR